MPKTSETVLQIDLKALAHNYRYLKAKLLPNTLFLGVVKAFAYGSDAIVIAQKLVDLGVDYFAVAYTQEGVLLRNAGITTPILVLHPQPSNFEEILENRLEPSLYSLRILKTFIALVKSSKLKDYPVHLKFNTGLNRLGFRENDVLAITTALKNQNTLKVLSVFSHLAASEDLSEVSFTKRQIRCFTAVIEELNQNLGYVPFRHLLNTSGIVNYPEAQYEMVRSGIGLYGFANTPDIDKNLIPVASLKTIISQIHEVAPQETVGYNRAFTADRFSVIATLPLGHADGIGRQYGNGKAWVRVQGRRAPIVGNVCMDMMMIDVTGINCSEGDEVILFGKENTAEAFAKQSETISYELLTGISQRVKRVLVDD